MFHRKQKGPGRPFSHDADCKILAADPSVEIQWSEVESGRWVAVCSCGEQVWYGPRVDERDRQDPLDPKTSRHAPQCAYAAEADPDLLKVLLKVRDGQGSGYWWVECGSCAWAWQVPFYAESVG